MVETGSVVVTGASTGIGRAIALALDRAGFYVFAGVRKTNAGEALRSEGSDRLEPVLLDVTNPDDIASVHDYVSRAVSDAGLTGLVNNAGITVNSPLEFIPMDALRRQLEVNVVGQVAVTQTFLPLLRKAKGRIVITGSTSGFLTAPVMGPYSMSKHAVESMADALRLELRPWRIHVALLQPGLVKTPIWEKGLADGDAFLDQAPAEMSELYGNLIRRLRDLAAGMGPKGSDPEVVARAVLHALTARRPRTRYLVGRNARIERTLSRLPTRLRDFLLAKTFGI
jgi:NAD(P)-dependent dehydrogenase (short-subunit alcohol dehydrogenase family)